MITLLFANLLAKKLDASTIWYLAAFELLIDAVAVNVLWFFVFVK